MYTTCTYVHVYMYVPSCATCPSVKRKTIWEERTHQIRMHCKVLLITYTCTCRCMHIHVVTSVRKYICRYIHVHVAQFKITGYFGCTCTCIYIIICLLSHNVHVHTYIMYIRTYVHTYVHTYTCTYMYIHDVPSYSPALACSRAASGPL